jgi:hypothetical protein
VTGFDPDELVRWAETYGHPEEWAKKAQHLHKTLERIAYPAGIVTVDDLCEIAHDALRACSDGCSGTCRAVGT